MLRIGKLTDYALLIISQMAKSPDTIMSATYLAETLHLTTPTVSKVLKILSDAQIVSSVRGADGGYHLARSATDVTLADVITAMEGELAMTECCDNRCACVLDTNCSMRENWRIINDKVQSLLASFTITDMLRPLSLAGSRGLSDDK